MGVTDHRALDVEGAVEADTCLARDPAFLGQIRASREILERQGHLGELRLRQLWLVSGKGHWLGFELAGERALDARCERPCGCDGLRAPTGLVHVQEARVGNQASTPEEHTRSVEGHATTASGELNAPRFVAYVQVERLESLEPNALDFLAA